MDLTTRLFTWLNGTRVGSDAQGNIYYESGKSRVGSYGRTRRWVAYVGAPDSTTVPAEWHAWLHHTTDAPIPELNKRAWQKPHLPNATGTAASYRPPGHDYQGGHRPITTGDYEAWTPETPDLER